MSVNHSGFAHSGPFSQAGRRHCYVKNSAVDQLLDAPGVLELLLEELSGEPSRSCSRLDGLVRLKRCATRLSLTPTAFHGLSLEEMVVLAAFASERFDHTDWKRELLELPSERELSSRCQAWLVERTDAVSSGASFGAARWSLVGHSPPAAPASRHFVVAVTPIADAAALEREPPLLASEACFAHEHYVACTPATALDYLARSAGSGRLRRWDPFTLDRRLGVLGLGLLLVERAGVALYLPARYQDAPRGALTTMVSPGVPAPL
jgi:hypothetical protein